MNHDSLASSALEGAIAQTHMRSHKLTVTAPLAKSIKTTYMYEW